MVQIFFKMVLWMSAKVLVGQTYLFISASIPHGTLRLLSSLSPRDKVQFVAYSPWSLGESGVPFWCALSRLLNRPIIMDPQLFERFSIHKVPVLVCTTPCVQKVYGVHDCKEFLRKIPKNFF